MSSEIAVSVIIVNYNTFPLVRQCIDSIIKETSNITFEIVVVDNNSPDQSIRELKVIFPEITLILQKENKGFGAGNNVGASIAKGKYLFFLNSDTILINNAIGILHSFMESCPNAGVCGGNLYTADKIPTISYEPLKPRPLVRTFLLLSQMITRRIIGGSVFFCNGQQPRMINGYISGADFFVKSDLLRKVGGFDEDFFMYYEEIELTYRINRHGLRSYVVPEAKIIHLEGGSQIDKSGKKKIWMKESRQLYYKKTGTKGLWLDCWEEKAIANFLKVFASN